MTDAIFPLLYSSTSEDQIMSERGAHRASGDDEDVDCVTAILKPIWAILPSVEARTSKLGNARSITPRSPKYRTPDSPPLSLSELDVRSLKALYDPKGSYTSPAVAGEFTIEDFAIRVQALITDDRALGERLIQAGAEQYDGA